MESTSVEEISREEASLPLTFAETDQDLLARVGQDSGDGPRAWRLNGDAHRLSLIQGFDRLLGWPSLRGVTRYDHQERAVLRVLREMRGRAILADEVGLGKTIEAGLVLKEYVLRGLVRRALILPPPSLVSQWREEMREKFSIAFQIARIPRDWRDEPLLIASLDTAKREPHRSAACSLPWDLVIVDEAHRLKSRTTLNWRFVASLRKKFMLLLTATPVQNNMEELFNLVSLLKPGQLHTYDAYLRRYVATKDRRMPARVGELRGRLRDIMVRQRRGVALSLPPRRVHPIAVRLSPAERDLYRGVTAFVRNAYGTSSRRLPFAAKLTLVVLQREIGSSTFAAAGTLRKLSESAIYDEEERDTLRALYDLADSIDRNEKAIRVSAFLRSTQEKVLVFTQYLRTLEYLQRVFESEGFHATTYHGRLSRTAKDRAIRAFRGDRQVFLSTDSGAEGRNLQFARTLVNYDLPWNPLRIEQRIGRVHRLGQEREVHVVNLWAPDTIEEYVMELLDRKIHMFELVVGELDLILGNLDEGRSFEDLLMEMWVLREAEDRRAALRRLSESLVNARARYFETKDLNAAILDAPQEEAAA